MRVSGLFNKCLRKINSLSNEIHGHRQAWSCLEDTLSGLSFCTLSFKQKGTITWKVRRPPSWSDGVLRLFILGCNTIKLIGLDLLFICLFYQRYLAYNPWSPLTNPFLIFPLWLAAHNRNHSVCSPSVVYSGIMSLNMPGLYKQLFSFLFNSPEVYWLSIFLLGILCQRIYLKSPWRWRENCTVKRADAWAGKWRRIQSRLLLDVCMLFQRPIHMDSYTGCLTEAGSQGLRVHL